MESKNNIIKMVNYTNQTYINLENLQTPPNFTIDIELNWQWVSTGIQNVFGTFSYLEVVQSLGIFAVFFIIFYNKKVLNLTNMQNILASSFITLVFNIVMLYSEYYSSFYMLGIMFVVWFVSLVTTIRDR